MQLTLSRSRSFPNVSYVPPTCFSPVRTRSVFLLPQQGRGGGYGHLSPTVPEFRVKDSVPVLESRALTGITRYDHPVSEEGSSLESTNRGTIVVCRV